MKKEVNVEELINTFESMVERGSLLPLGSVKDKQDILIQIIGTIVKVAMDSEKKAIVDR